MNDVDDWRGLCLQSVGIVVFGVGGCSYSSFSCLYRKDQPPLNAIITSKRSSVRRVAFNERDIPGAPVRSRCKQPSMTAAWA
ncbi:uncharacterized protein LAESUDRAFT_150757 [Laetiporus sulphureus 93-53]|uniref:Uncharacterized protein n=1 Tax=Laetiporus sulphureus 93-53 TaxID=1314785 RepID=A0A165HHT0_9APHY|nr:uncharacterized protein LAESUDRAFT_150757 [Laetiporus sulphureus 93-53]KZT11750.1 hypothetical protein LAESUDRAFT_150757 [Laetiporus sulphureus 93-53]